MAPPRRCTRLLVLVLVTALLAVLLPGSAQAAAASVTQVFRADVAGDIALAGNGLETCKPGSISPYGTKPTCEAGRSKVQLDSQTMSNNDIPMVYIDADDDPSTSNSSSSMLKMPADAKVLHAVLTWSMGSEKVPGQSRRTIKLKAPGTSSYTTLTAEPQGGVSFADVTDLVAAAGAGTYWGADALGDPRDGDHAGWGLAVAFSSPSEPVRNLAIFTGPVTVGSTNKSATVAVNNISTPATGTVSTRVGVVAFEGDRGFGADGIKLGSKALVDARNPSGDFFNSTHSDLGVTVTGDTPSYNNLLGTDVDRVSVSNAIPNNATSTSLTLTTDTDGYTASILTFASAFYAPDVALDPTLSDLDAGLLEPGDVLEVRTTARNQGSEDATGTSLSLSVPAGTTLVPGSSTSTTGSTSETAGAVSAPMAASAMGVGQSSTLAFKVKVEESAVGSSLTTTATASYKGTTTTKARTSTAQSKAKLVQRPRSDVSVRVTLPSEVAQVGIDSSVAWEAEVTNTGPSASRPLALTLSAPSGLTPASIDGCGTSCTLPSLPAGASTTLRGTFALSDGDFSTKPSLSVQTQALVWDPDTSNNTAVLDVLVNRAPVARPDTVSTTVAGSLVDVLANDTDADGDSLVVTSASADHGTAVVEGTRVRYTPTKGYRGADTITYVVEDTSGRTAGGTAAVVVSNTAPTLVDDVLEASHGTSRVDVLSNDADADGDSLSVTSASAAGGSVTLVGGGVLEYEPSRGRTGHDTITYVVEDGFGGTSTASVGVGVANAGPVAEPDTLSTTVAGSLVDVLTNDTDADGDSLSIASASADHGTAVVEGTRVRYTPTKGYRGADTITYVVEDGFGGSDQGSVSVKVLNTAPSALTGVLEVTRAGGSLDLFGLVQDADGDATIITSVSTSSGDATLDSGTLTYVPSKGSHSPVTITYVVEDGFGGSSDGRVSVNVLNTVPVAEPDALSTTVAGSLVDVLANDTDADGDSLSIASVSAEHGSTAVEGAKVRYTPTKGYRGADTITYVVEDGFGGSSQGSVDVSVTNTAPTLGALALTVQAGAEVDLDVLAGASDADGDVLELSAAVAGTGTAAASSGLVHYKAPRTPGGDVIEYEVQDALGARSAGRVEVEVVKSTTDSDDEAGPTTPPVVTPPGDGPTAPPSEAPNSPPSEDPTDPPTSGPTTPPTSGPTAPPVVTPPSEDPAETPTSEPTAPPTTAPTAPPVANPPSEGPTEPPTSTPPVEVPPTDETSTPPSGTAPVLAPNPRPVSTPAPSAGGPSTGGGPATSLVRAKVLDVVEVSSSRMEVDVLDGATSTTGRPLGVSLAGGPYHGLVTVEAGRLVYVPVLGWSGDELVTYVISDGVTSLVMTVVIRVLPETPALVVSARPATAPAPAGSSRARSAAAEVPVPRTGGVPAAASVTDEQVERTPTAEQRTPAVPVSTSADAREVEAPASAEEGASLAPWLLVPAAVVLLWLLWLLVGRRRHEEEGRA